MPRTKAPRKIKQERAESVKSNPEIEKLEKFLDAQEKKALELLESEYVMVQMKLKAFLREERCKIKKKDEFRTIAEVTSTFGESTNAISIMKSTRKSSRKRSKSVLGDDEGYLTAESTRSASGTRLSRTQQKEPRTKGRMSRSLSRSNLQKSVRNNKQNPYKTPQAKHPPSFDVITPKVKPNTPQVILRRPKQGEVAVSLQGSPLMVGSVVTDQESTVSIPLRNGCMLAIAPHRGLRVSELPELDPQTQKELETLRDNLSKMCARNAIRK